MAPPTGAAAAATAVAAAQFTPPSCSTVIPVLKQRRRQQRKRSSANIFLPYLLLLLLCLLCASVLYRVYQSLGVVHKNDTAKNHNTVDYDAPQLTLRSNHDNGQRLTAASSHSKKQLFLANDDDDSKEEESETDDEADIEQEAYSTLSAQGDSMGGEGDQLASNQRADNAESDASYEEEFASDHQEESVISSNMDDTTEPCHNDTTIQAPTFILAGAQKAGTSALFMILRKHPNLMSTKRFEAHFFDRLPTVNTGTSAFGNLTEDQVCRYRHNYLNEFDVTTLRERKQRLQMILDRSSEGEMEREDYERLMQRNTLLTFEKTPVYLCLSAVPEHVKRITPWAKIIVILRNPVDRAYSEYKMLKENKLATAANRNNTANPAASRTIGTFDELVARHVKRFHSFNLTTAPGLAMYKWATKKRAARSSSSGTAETDAHIAELGLGRNITYSFAIPNDLQTVERRNRFIATIFAGAPLYQRSMRCSILFRGMYAQQLAYWMQHFALHQTLMVVRYERFVEDRITVLAEILEFLGAPPLAAMLERNANFSAVLERSYAPFQSRRIQHEPIGNVTREYLRRFYKPYNDELADLLGEEWRNVWD